MATVRIDFLVDPTTEAEQSWLTEWGLGKSTVGLDFFLFLILYNFFFLHLPRQD